MACYVYGGLYYNYNSNVIEAEMEFTIQKLPMEFYVQNTLYWQ